MASAAARRDQRPDRDRAADLPHSPSAEASILGGILLRPDVLERIPALEPGHFYDPRNRAVFAAMRNLAAAGTPIDTTTLETRLAADGWIDAASTFALLGELALSCPAPDNVVAYAADVMTFARNRAALVELGAALTEARSWPHDPAELVDEVAGRLARFAEDTRAPDDETRRIRWTQPLESFLGDEEPDDDDAADWIIRDIIPRGEPALWAGPMKAGKTWAALDLAIAIALGEPWLGRCENTTGGPARVLGLFLEDNRRRLAKRLWELTRGRYKTPNDPTLRDHLRLSRAPLHLPDARDQRALSAELRAFNPAVVIVDNLTRVMVGDPNKTSDAAAFTRAWLELCDVGGAAVLFLHHTRKAAGDGGRDVDPFDQIRGSTDFGAAARNVIVSMPLRTVEEEKLAEVRMRGNLDLRNESFVLGFERIVGPLGRWQAKLVDRGEVSDVKEKVSSARRDDKEDKRRRELEQTYEKRKNIALELAHRTGSVTAPVLASAVGLSSPRAVAPVLERMVSERLLEPAGRSGYRVAGSSPQESIV